MLKTAWREAACKRLGSPQAQTPYKIYFVVGFCVRFVSSLCQRKTPEALKTLGFSFPDNNDNKKL
jgi:hypothetical protein